jgi:hypothetical protein
MISWTCIVINSIIFWDMTPCSPLSFKHRFGGTYRLHLQGLSWRWRRYIPPKRRLKLNGLHGVISQKMILFITTAVKTSIPSVHCNNFLYNICWVTPLGFSIGLRPLPTSEKQFPLLLISTNNRILYICIWGIKLKFGDCIYWDLVSQGWGVKIKVPLALVSFCSYTSGWINCNELWYLELNKLY